MPIVRYPIKPKLARKIPMEGNENVMARNALNQTLLKIISVEKTILLMGSISIQLWKFYPFLMMNCIKASLE